MNTNSMHKYGPENQTLSCAIRHLEKLSAYANVFVAGALSSCGESAVILLLGAGTSSGLC